MEAGRELKCGSPREQGGLTGTPFEPFCPRGPCGVETERMESWLAHPSDRHLTDPSYSPPRLGAQGGLKGQWDQGDPGERTSGSLLMEFISGSEKPSVPSRHSLQPSGPQRGGLSKAPLSLNKPLSFQTRASLTPTVCKTSPSLPPHHPSFEHSLPTRGRTHTHRLSLGARRALHAWQPLVPFLTGLPRGADEAN